MVFSWIIRGRVFPCILENAAIQLFAERSKTKRTRVEENGCARKMSKLIIADSRMRTETVQWYGVRSHGPILVVFIFHARTDRIWLVLANWILGFIVRQSDRRLARNSIVPRVYTRVEKSMFTSCCDRYRGRSSRKKLANNLRSNLPFLRFVSADFSADRSIRRERDETTDRKMED